MPSNILFEDDRFVVFPDISPAARVHLLVITKVAFKCFPIFDDVIAMQEHIKDVQSLTAEDIPMVKDMKGVKLSMYVADEPINMSIIGQ